MSITTVQELAALPDGTVVIPTADCLWPSRYAGRRFLKRDLVMEPLDPDPYDKSPHVCAIALFKDPLPAEVSS